MFEIAINSIETTKEYSGLHQINQLPEAASIVLFTMFHHSKEHWENLPKNPWRVPPCNAIEQEPTSSRDPMNKLHAVHSPAALAPS